MAALREQKRADGSTRYKVEWRLGGTRTGATTSESFDDRGKARRFQEDVEDSGHQWPEGWVRGQGYVNSDEPAEAEILPTLFSEFASTYVSERTRVQPDTRLRYRRQVTKLVTELTPIVGGTVTIEGLTESHIRQWIIWRGAQSDGSPKTVANYHGLLFGIMNTAKRRALRPDNPCEITGSDLPRQDDDIDNDADMIFLTKSQFGIIAAAIRPESREFITVLVGTGLRFSELTALQPRDLNLDGAAPHLVVRRAWKRVGAPEETPAKAIMHDNGRFYLGPPKSRKSRRRVTVAPMIADILRQTAIGKEPDSFLFTSPGGKHIDHAHFGRDSWYKALDEANRKGLTVRPRIHDLRHTHAAWLISDGVPLAVIRDRLGHDSITTTVNTYGGLTVESHEGADRTIEAALTGIFSLALVPPVDQLVSTGG